MDLSILICTRNRADKLQQTLEAIRISYYPADLDFEIIVIDNASTDHTTQICEDVRSHFSGRFRMVYAPIPGLGRARNVGLEAAQGEIITFIDDDIIPQRDWLAVIWNEFSQDRILGAISGRVELANLVDLPLTIRRHTKRATFESMGDAFNIFSGCMIAFRARMKNGVGRFDPDLGIGSRFPSAEDADFWYRAWKSGEKLVYVPELVVYHDHGRRSMQAKRKLVRGYVLGRGAFYAKHAWEDPTVAREMYWEMSRGVRDWLHGHSEMGWHHLAWLMRGFLGYATVRTARYFSRLVLGPHNILPSV